MIKHIQIKDYKCLHDEKAPVFIVSKELGNTILFKPEQCSNAIYPILIKYWGN